MLSDKHYIFFCNYLYMNSKLSIFFLGFITLSAFILNQNQNQSLLNQFQSWKLQFQKTYETRFEEAYRLRLFILNYIKIEAHNQKQDSSYKLGLNQFSDLTEFQFASQHLNPKMFQGIYKIQSQVQEISGLTGNQINWVQKGYVTSVKNQGQCGACWAFSAVGAVQGLGKISSGSLIQFSAQQLIDCSFSYGNNGCNGGLMDYAFRYIKEKGIIQQSKYPYTGKYQTCQIDGGVFKVSGFTDVSNCNNLATAIMKQPISVAVDAVPFIQYKSGILTCPTKFTINHAVVLVGMTDDYWLAKEQFGVNWGQNGYIKLARGNSCGICNIASYPNK